MIGTISAEAGSKSLTGYTVATGDPVLVEDWANDERFGKSQGIADLGISSLMMVPIDAPVGAFG